MTPTLLGQGIDKGGDDVKHLPQNDQKKPNERNQSILTIINRMVIYAKEKLTRLGDYTCWQHLRGHSQRTRRNPILMVAPIVHSSKNHELNNLDKLI